MSAQGVPKRGQRTEDFLLAEYKLFSDSFWRNEETGERRVNFFITLVTAVIAALVALGTNETTLQRDATYGVILFALLGLLVFGGVTFLRMIHRNKVTDEYKRAIDLIRAYFTEEDDRLKDYRPFVKRKTRRLGTGGLVEMVAIANSLILVALGGMIAFLFRVSAWGIGLIAFIVFLSGWFVQFRYVKGQYESESRSNTEQSARN